MIGEGRRGAARPGRAGAARAAVEVPVPGRHDADRPRQRAQGAGGRRGRAGRAVDPEADGGVRHVHPGAEARDRQAVPDAGGGRVHDLRPRHGGDGPRRARHRQGRRGDRDRRASGDTAKTVVHGRRDVPQAAGRGPAATTSARCCAGRSARRSSAGRCWRKPGTHHAAQEVQGRGLHPEEGGGRAPHAVLQGLPAAVLLPDDGRDRAR